MDVQAVAPTLASATFTLPPPTPAGTDGTPAPSNLPGLPSNGASAQGSLQTSVSATPGLALLPPPVAGAGESSGGGSLSSNVAKVFNVPESTVQVSFQQAQDSNEIVTVFTDTLTHKVIVQIPSESLIALAQFFQKIDANNADNGAVVDKKV